MNRITEMDITWRVISRRGKGENREKGKGIKKHNGKIQNRGMLRIAQEMEKSKNLYAQPMDMN